jgi:hypothetical protein
MSARSILAVAILVALAAFAVGSAGSSGPISMQPASAVIADSTGQPDDFDAG